jgi:hypothetical protein
VTVRSVATRAGDAIAPAFFVLYAVGFLISAFTQLDHLRTQLVGDAVVAAWAPALLVGAVSALAWRGLAAGRWRWLHPADLTWRADGDRRVLVVRRRMATSWGLRLAAVLYAWAWAGAIAELPAPWWAAGSTAVVVVALAALLALWPPPPGRTELIEGWRERGIRRTAVRFLDPLMLVAAARPLALSLVGASLLRFLALEGLDRGSGPVHAALLLLVAVAVLQIAPALPAAAVLAVLGYVAALPAATGLARVWPVPGLRRWMPVSDRRLRCTAGALVAVVAGSWVAAVVALTGAAVGVSAVAAVAVLVAVAVVRTLARPPLVVDSTSAVVLVIRTLRGVDVLAVGTVLLVALGL